MPNCVDCRYVRLADLTCGHTANRSVVTGAVTYPMCDHVRASDGRCGPEGRLFESSASGRLYDAAPKP